MSEPFDFHGIDELTLQAMLDAIGTSGDHDQMDRYTFQQQQAHAMYQLQHGSSPAETADNDGQVDGSSKFASDFQAMYEVEIPTATATMTTTTTTTPTKAMELPSAEIETLEFNKLDAPRDIRGSIDLLTIPGDPPSPRELTPSFSAPPRREITRRRIHQSQARLKEAIRMASGSLERSGTDLSDSISYILSPALGAQDTDRDASRIGWAAQAERSASHLLQEPPTIPPQAEEFEGEEFEVIFPKADAKFNATFPLDEAFQATFQPPLGRDVASATHTSEQHVSASSMAKKTKIKKSKKKKHKKFVKMESPDDGEPDAEGLQGSYGSLHESDNTQREDNLPMPSFVADPEFAGSENDNINWSQHTQGDPSTTSAVPTTSSMQTAVRRGSRKEGSHGVSHDAHRSKSSAWSSGSSQSSMQIEKLMANNRDLFGKGHHSAPTQSANDASWASMGRGHHSSPISLPNDATWASFSVDKKTAKQLKAASEHHFDTTSSFPPVSEPSFGVVDSSWAAFQRTITPPPPTKTEQFVDEPDSATTPGSPSSEQQQQRQQQRTREDRDSRLRLARTISGLEISQDDDAKLKVGAYRKVKHGNDIDPESLGTFPDYSIQPASHVSEHDSHFKVTSKSIASCRCSRLRVMIALGVLLVGALILGLSLGLRPQASPPINEVVLCDVEGISRQCIAEGQIVDLPSCAQGKYDELRASFIQTLNPDFTLEADSCDSANVALIHLASRSTGQESIKELTNVYLLNLFYLVTDGQGWFKSNLWMSDESYCSWLGVTCNSDSEVITIHLEHNNLHGKLPTEIGLFPVLHSISLAENDISHTIPSELGMLSSLILVDLHNNILEGMLPTEIGLLTEMQSFDFSSNHLLGTIPTVVGEMSSLVNLYLNDNHLTSSIPSEIGLCRNLVVLLVNSNELSNAIPTELGAMRRVQVLDLENNIFSGSTIPSELGLLSNLLVLKMTGSNLNGTLPTELGNLESLNILHAGSSTLTGTIPTELERLTELEVLNLNMNRLVGTLPTQIGEMQRLTRLDISYNRIVGSLPTELGRLSNLRILLVLGTLLTGEVPSQVCSLATLNTFQADYCEGDLLTCTADPSCCKGCT